MNPYLALKQINKTFLFIFISLLFFITGFSLGLHLHGTFSQWIYEGKKNISDFSCYGHNNLWETYQWDCYKKKLNITFHMSNHLKCNELQSSGLWDDSHSSITKHFYLIDSIKTNYINFTITIDPSSKTLTRSNTGGEVAKGTFNITHDDEKMMIALRKAPIGDPFFAETYEQILILKTSGKGIITGYNSPDKLGNAENLGSTFMQCQSVQ